MNGVIAAKVDWVRMTTYVTSALILVASIFIIAVNSQVSAATSATNEACTGPAAGSPVCVKDNQDPLAGPDGLILRATAIIAYFIGFISVVMIIVAGIKFATSAGSAESVASARNTVLFALIGLVVAASAQLIVGFVLSLL